MFIFLAMFSRHQASWCNFLMTSHVFFNDVVKLMFFFMFAVALCWETNTQGNHSATANIKKPINLMTSLKNTCDVIRKLNQIISNKNINGLRQAVFIQCIVIINVKTYAG